MILSSQSLKKLPLAKAQYNKALIVIVGPTASGKSSLAHALARIYRAAIICADSRTIYQGLTIGSAKPTKEERAEVAYYGLDLIAPNQQFSAYDFVTYAKSTLEEIWRQQKIAIVVGGSGMYIDALLFDYTFRQAIRSADDLRGLSDNDVKNIVLKLYPEKISEYDLANRRRLEHIYERGIAIASDRKSIKYDALLLGLGKNKQLLKQNIQYRLNKMLNQGFVQEVKELRAIYSHDAPGLNATGYRAINRILNEKGDEAHIFKAVETETTLLAKKQLTWFNRNPYISWLDGSDQAVKLVDDYLARKRVQ